MTAEQVRAAEVVLPCPELDDTLAFFTDRLGFRVDSIFPADDPDVAVISGYGVRLRLERGAGTPAVLRLRCDRSTRETLMAPNGTRVELVPAESPVVLPPLQAKPVIRRADGEFCVGRAGMRYRDLIPGRQGGRVIASHIRIPDGGPVPDYVHFHRVRFQVIFCYRGWVRVVYEDQGPPFVMNAGDCVLQAPQIRHRVLECSPGLEVIEIGCPAAHETHADHDLELPTAEHRPDRRFDGQPFVRHVASDAQWRSSGGFDYRDTGIAAATDGLVSVRVARSNGGPTPERRAVETELYFAFVLGGAASLDLDSDERLEVGDCVALPRGACYGFSECSADLELLELTADPETGAGERQGSQ